MSYNPFKTPMKLFNIYDVILFANEKGLHQDCICSIKRKNINGEKVYNMQCNNYSISIYKNGNYEVYERDGKNMPYYITNNKIISIYTRKPYNNEMFYQVYPTNEVIRIENDKIFGVYRRISKGITQLKKSIDTYSFGKPLLYVRYDKENIVIITQKEYNRLKEIEKKQCVVKEEK